WVLGVGCWSLLTSTQNPTPNTFSWFIPHPLNHPRVAARVVGEVAFGVASAELFVAREQALVASVGGVNRAVRNLLQVALDLPDVPGREAPVVVAEFVKVRHAVARDAARRVNVSVEVAPGELPQVSKDRAATVKAQVARARDRAPQAAPAED